VFKTQSQGLKFWLEDMINDFNDFILKTQFAEKAILPNSFDTLYFAKKYY